MRRQEEKRLDWGLGNKWARRTIYKQYSYGASAKDLKRQTWTVLIRRWATRRRLESARG